MKLNYRDTVILGILLAIVILIAGFVGLVKPKTQTLNDDKATLETKQSERDEVEGRIAQIEPLKKEINQTYEDTNKLAEDFVDYENLRTSTDLDQLMQDYAEQCEVEVEILNAGTIDSYELPYYYFSTSVAGESLLVASDINGDRQEQLAAERAESDSLSQRAVQQVLRSQYGLSVKGSKENIWKYMQMIEEQPETILINSVAINDYTFGESGETGLEDESQVQFVLSLYSVYEMQKPNTDPD